MPARISPRDLKKEARTVEDIIGEGVHWQEVYDEASNKLKALKEEVKPFFQRKKTKEELKTQAGSALLTISNSWGIKDAFVDKLRTIFGNKTKLYVTEKTQFKPTAAFKTLCNDRTILNDEYGKNGEIILDAAKIDQRETVKFSA